MKKTILLVSNTSRSIAYFRLGLVKDLQDKGFDVRVAAPRDEHKVTIEQVCPFIELKKLDRKSVTEALSRSGGNKAKAARFLGVGRATLYRFLSDHPDVS